MLIKNLTFQTLIAALAGVVLATIIAEPAWLTAPEKPAFYELIIMLKQVFLAALRMLIAPMIFFSLIGGIIGIGNVVRLKALGGITVSYYLSTTLIAIGLGLFAVFFIHPWTAYPPAVEVPATASHLRMIDPGSDSLILVIKQILMQAFTNPFSALVKMNILGIVTNAFLIGIAMVLVLPADSKLFEIVHQVNQVIYRILGWVIKLLPIGIFAILFDFSVKLSVGDGHSADFLTQLIQFAGLVVALTLIHGLLVLPLIGWFFARRSPVDTLRKIARPLLVAFSTSSSSATLPVSMQTCDETLKINPSVSSFVLPLGATMNMDGTALFEAVAAIFLAYLYGIELSNVAIFTVFFMSMVSSIGAPGMPTASMSGMQMVLLAVGIPLEAIAILLIIERPLDTIRTALNVEGDLYGAMVVDHQTRSAEGRS
ncbi:MAG: dicarboxylate/amino acid:cation symporter [Pseudomonadales bacterium]|nr:dicarboxylate/amino acid:cation symporter [Pseudomonadales bacterium]